MTILEQGPGWVAFLKPAGYHVHPPESGDFRVPRDKILLYEARRIMKTRVYPVHRLDVGTMGVLLMALDSATASYFGRQFQERRVRKTYVAVARGWLPDAGEIDRPLELDSTGELAEALTSFRTLARLEIPEPVGKRFDRARASLLEVEPRTGRFHQIRRHFNRISHPLIGDGTHGDSHHNRFWREKMGINGLCLKAQRLEVETPEGARAIEAPDDAKWARLRELFAATAAPGSRES